MQYNTLRNYNAPGGLVNYADPSKCLSCVKITAIISIVAYFGYYIMSLISSKEDYNNCKYPMTLWLTFELIFIAVFLVTTLLFTLCTLQNINFCKNIKII
jgi:magnesium-transporting ATPase (P-type)